MRNPRILLADRSDDLVAQVRSVATTMRPEPEVVVCERVACFDDVVHEDQAFDVLIAGPALANRSGLGRLAVLHTEVPTLSVILSFTERPDANLRDIVRTGAVDLVHLPIADDLLRETIERAIAMSRSDPLLTQPPSGARRGQQGTVVTVTSPAGGSGKTVLATNIAYFVHKQTGLSTCLVDLDLEFGRVANALRLRPRYTIIDLVKKDESPDEELKVHVSEYLAEHDSGVCVLAAPSDAGDAELISSIDVIRALQAIRSQFDFVVVDTAVSLGDVVLSALDMSDFVYVVSAVDLPSLRNLRRFLATLKELKVSDEGIRLIVNKEELDTGVDISEVAKLYEQSVSIRLPYSRDVTRSLNFGVPVLAYRPEAEFCRRLAAGLGELLQAAGVAPEAPDHPPRRSGWRRIFNR